MRTFLYFLLLLVISSLAQADVLPPAQDSSSLSGKLTTATGKANSLTIKATRKGYVQFPIENLPPDLAASDIADARLRIYITNVITAGDIGLHTVTAPWNEKTAMSEPGVSVSPIATISALTVVGKQFVEVDVTATVQGWLAAPATNYGFAFVVSGATNVLIGAKEGSGSGYPCELEIQIDRVIAEGAIGNAQLAAGTAVANLTDASVPVTKLASSSLTINADSGLSGGGTVSLGGSVNLSLADNLTLGGTTSGTFSGNGSGLTNLPAAQITGQLTASQLSSNLTLGGTTTGTFSGDGSALTNIPGLKYNLQQVAMLKWGPTTINNTYSVGSGPFGVCFDGNHVWVTNTFSDNVKRLNPNTGETIDTYSAGGGPAGVCFDGTYIWIANQDSANLTRVNPVNGAIQTFSAGASPFAICFDGTSIWATNINTNNVTKLNPSTGAVIGTYNVGNTPPGSGPLGICFDGSSIWVTNNFSNSVTKLNASTGANLGTFPVGSGPYGICFDGSAIWVVNYLSNNVTKLNSNTGATIGTYTVATGGVGAVGICFDGANIWVSNAGQASVTKLNPSTGAIVATHNTGVTPECICFDGANIWVANRDSNNVTKF